MTEGNDMQDIEQHLKALGFLDVGEMLTAPNCPPITNCPTMAHRTTMEKGYFNDPRDGNGEVPY